MADPALAEERRRLRASCRHLPGHGPAHPAHALEQAAAWIREHDPAPDSYGAGAVLEDFEREVAGLLGFAAARFMPSGCMAQPIALRIWSARAGIPVTAFHATSHLELHEDHGYRALHGLTAHLLGDPTRPTLARDLDALLAGPARESGLASLLVELPAREIGGQLPSWDELVELSARCRERGVRLHLDGARLWQVPAAYGRELREVCALFDSAYVSFYKDVGALPGAMLLGPEDLIAEAKTWQRRQGGTLHTVLPALASARALLAPRLARMPRYRARALEVARRCAALPGVEVTPDPPHTSMFHLLLEGTPDALAQRRDAVARETGVWLFGGASPRPDGRSKVELSLGEASLALDDATLDRALAAFAG